MLKSIYFKNTNFRKAKCENNSSWLWKSIIKKRYVIEKGISWEVSNGEGIKFWKEPWISSIKGFKIQFRKLKNNSIEYIKNVITKTKE